MSAAVAVHPPTGDSVALGGRCSFGGFWIGRHPCGGGVFFAFFFFFSPLLWHFSQLIHRPRSSPASVLFTFVVGSRCVHSFMQTNCSGTYIVRILLGHGRRTALAAFTETSWLVLPAQPPRAFCVRGHLCLLSLLCSGYGTCAVSPFQGEGKTTFSWRADE